MEKLKWHNEKRKVRELIPWDKNPRKMTDEQARQLDESLEKFDLVEVPAINTDNRLIAGHQRAYRLMLKGRGEEEIDVRVPNRSLTPEEFKEYNLRSNKNTGEWDWKALAEFEQQILANIGFDSKELDKIFKTYDDEDFDADAEAEKIIEPIAKYGDIYQLGEHRLMCGDSSIQQANSRKD